VDLEARVGKDHPLRTIRLVVNDTLATMERDLAALYSGIGRPSIAPEKLLRATLLQAFYSVRFERQLMERLEFHLLFRWFVGIGVDEPVWDHSTFSKNRDRLLEGAVAARFLSTLIAHPKVKRLLSTEHFSVDGTLVQVWASMKSFKAIDGADEPPPPMGGRNVEANFRGETRSNATHASTTDPDAKLYRNGPGMEARLAFLGHALMENRSGLIVDACLNPGERPCRAHRRTGDDRAARRSSRRPDARRRQRLQRRRLRERTALDERPPACGAEHDPPVIDGGRPHHAPSRLHREPAHPKADRGGVPVG
jgi:transposase